MARPWWDETLTQLIGERGINARVGNVRRCDAGANWRVAWGNPTAACKPWLLALLKFQQYRTRAWPYRASKSRINRSEEHTSELQSLMRISYAVFCLKKKTKDNKTTSYQSS